MPDEKKRVIMDDDVFALTNKGQKELHGSATSLVPAALEVLVLIDGKSTVGETVARARTTGRETLLNILENLLYDGLIDFANDQTGSPDFIDFFQTKSAGKPSAEATAKARKDSAATALLLQQKGYAVRIARRAGAEKRAEPSRTLSVLVVEDEPYLASMLTHVLANEGFDVRTAKNRGEIVAEFRRQPPPDLVLLDVTLPDADGFDVLLRVREHPRLKDLPVVMLTAKATRDAVLKGLAGGADGYITKPFEIDVLVKAVNVVLGRAEGEADAEEQQDPWVKAANRPI